MYLPCLSKFYRYSLVVSLLLMPAAGKPVSASDLTADGLPYDHGSMPIMISATDGATGEKLYMDKGCIDCHGPRGFSEDPDMFPKIAGLDKQYIIDQLLAFRSGGRRNVIMSPVAETLTPDDIIALAVFVSGK